MTDDSLATGSAFGTLPTDEINYMRNAVKATVDAYDGSVNLYAWDESDPILQGVAGRVPRHGPGPAPTIPDSLLEHLRYPEDQFKVQRFQFAKYHVTNEGDFYQGNNRWAVPQDPYLPSQYQPPYRLFVNEGTEQQFSLTSTYVPSREEQPRGLRVGERRRDRSGRLREDEGPPAAQRADTRSRPGRQRHGHRPGRA